MVTTRIIGMQAESLINSALTGNKNLVKNATSFFRSAQEQPGNAILAIHSEIRKRESNTLVGWFKEQIKYNGSIRKKLESTLEEAVKSDYNLLHEFNLFKILLKRNIGKSLDKRISIAQVGTVKFDNRVAITQEGKSAGNLYKKSLYDKFKIRINENAKNGFLANIFEDLRVMKNIFGIEKSCNL